MGVLSECLLLLLLVQALSIFTVQGEEAVDQPKGPIDDDLDLSPEQETIRVLKRASCRLEDIGKDPFPAFGYRSCTCVMSMRHFDKGSLQCKDKIRNKRTETQGEALDETRPAGEYVEDEGAQVVNKRFLTCYDSNAKIIKNGKKGIIENKLGRWRCKCEDGQWPDVNDCETLEREKREIAPEEDTFLNFLEKRGKGKGGKGAKKPKGGKCNQPKKKRGRSVRQLNDDYVDWHNYYRCLHGVGKVGYSKALETVAKANVQMNVRQGGMSHTSNSQYGENLWAMWGTGFGLGAITGQDPVKAWYDEMKDPGYDFRAPTMFSYGTGHFTQVVWAATKKIGCFTAEHPYQGMTRVFTACEYDPPGNMNMRPRAKNVENWKKNVPKPK